MSLHVQLEKFEGPLGLLLYLIRKEEMDIFDINIHHITRQYLEYIRLMRELDLEMAGEFVAMAATLIQIKSRMLLPQYDDSGEVVEQEDPRKELVQKLLEYQKFKEAAQRLSERPWLHRDLWVRGVRETLDLAVEDAIVIDEGGLFSLISAYRKVVRTMKKNAHRVRSKAKSIAERVLEIRHLFRIGQRILLRDLVDKDGIAGPRQVKVLITFLSLLELAKLGFVSMFQAQIYGDIYIDPKREIQDDIISRVEEFEVDHAAVANKIFADGAVGAVTQSGDQGVSPDELTSGAESPSLDELGPTIFPGRHEIDVVQAQEAQLSLLQKEDLLDPDVQPGDEDLVGVEAATDEEILAEEVRLHFRVETPELAPSGQIAQRQESERSIAEPENGHKNRHGSEPQVES